MRLKKILKRLVLKILQIFIAYLKVQNNGGNLGWIKENSLSPNKKSDDLKTKKMIIQIQ